MSVNGVSCAATISIGVAVSMPGESLDSAMRAADQAGYEAKRCGRDRWSIAKSTGPSRGFAGSSLQTAGITQAA